MRDVLGPRRNAWMALSMQLGIVFDPKPSSRYGDSLISLGTPQFTRPAVKDNYWEGSTIHGFCEEEQIHKTSLSMIYLLYLSLS